jgi:hypothetical protein
MKCAPDVAARRTHHPSSGRSRPTGPRKTRPMTGSAASRRIGHGLSLSLSLSLSSFEARKRAHLRMTLRQCISALIMSAAFSPIMMVGALVLPPIKVGMIEASTTRRLSSP